MEFNGAEEYFFYKGLEEAQEGTVEDLDVRLDTLIALEINIAERLRGAFRIGYELGLYMSRGDYLDLISPPKRDIVEPAKWKGTKKEKVWKEDSNLKGNC